MIYSLARLRERARVRALFKETTLTFLLSLQGGRGEELVRVRACQFLLSCETGRVNCAGNKPTSKTNFGFAYVIDSSVGPNSGVSIPLACT